MLLNHVFGLANFYVVPFTLEVIRGMASFGFSLLKSEKWKVQVQIPSGTIDN